MENHITGMCISSLYFAGIKKKCVVFKTKSTRNMSPCAGIHSMLITSVYLQIFIRQLLYCYQYSLKWQLKLAIWSCLSLSNNRLKTSPFVLVDRLELVVQRSNYIHRVIGRQIVCLGFRTKSFISSVSDEDPDSVYFRPALVYRDESNCPLYILIYMQ